MEKTITETHGGNSITYPMASDDDLNLFWRDIGIIKNMNIGSQEDAARMLPIREIAEIIAGSYDEMNREMNKSLWKMAVAPKNKIIEDTLQTLEQDNINLVRDPFAEDLSVMAIHGHAQSTHGAFRGKGYCNTDTDTVLEALEGNKIRGIEGLTRESSKKRSQGTIDELVYFAEDYLTNIIKYPWKQIQSPMKRLLTRDGQPIGGLEFASKMPIHLIRYLEQFTFGWNMDSYENREKVKQTYGHRMGGGDLFPMEKRLMMEYGIDMRHLSEKNPSGLFGILKFLDNEKSKELLTQLGIIKSWNGAEKEIDPLKENWNSMKSERAINLLKNPNIRNQYVRYERGLGCSDDIAIFLSAFSPHEYSGKPEQNLAMSGLMGTLMADKIDTLEKNSMLLFPGGQDEFIGKYFNTLFQTACRTSRNFREAFGIKKRADEQYTLTPERTLVDFTAASANTKDAKIHSSQRWLYKDLGGTSAISEYMKQVFSILRYEGLQTPSDREIRDGYHVEMKATSPSVAVTMKQIPLESVLSTMKERYNLVRNPRERENKLTQFYSKK